jgi:hypothetical protein
MQGFQRTIYPDASEASAFGGVVRPIASGRKSPAVVVRKAAKISQNLHSHLHINYIHTNYYYKISMLYARRPVS